MRVLIVALALVATPFAASVSQSSTSGTKPAYGTSGARGQGHSAELCTMRDTLNRTSQDIGRDSQKCPTPPPPPPPPPAANPCGANAPTTGSDSISGRVFSVDASGTRVGLSGWCVQVTGTTASGAAVSGAVATDAQGYYQFPGLPDGNYTVCQVIQTGWVQNAPTMGIVCTATGLYGYNLDISGGWNFGFVDFRDSQAP